MTNQPTFSIIMRTCGRPVMLHRALQSVCKQTYDNYELILVHDGDNPEVSLKIYEEYVCTLTSSKILHINSNRHMEKTTNKGLEYVTGKYICIHDDDDSWHPTFLEEVLKELENTDNSFPAVMTQFNKIYEIYDPENNAVKEICRNNSVEWLQSLQLGFILAGNIFPPISLVYSREILECIGMYDENLPVLGDWDFLIRLAYFTNIKVIKKPIANYHIRVNPSGVYGNSINTEGWNNLHIEYEPYIRRKYQSTKVLLPTFEKKDIGSDIVNARAFKNYWHWDYIKEIENIMNIQKDYKESTMNIIEKIKEKYKDKTPSIYLYGAGQFFEELVSTNVIELFEQEFKIRGLIDRKFDSALNHYPFIFRKSENSETCIINRYPTSILKDNLDIDVLIVSLKYPPDAVGILKQNISKNVDVYCIGGNY